MAEKSSFFNAIINNGIPDRAYKAEEFAKYFSSFIGNGVFPNPSTNLQVLALDNNMTVRVKTGKAWINGYSYHNDSDLILQIDNADGVLKRIDRVVVRLDFLNRNITTKIKKGTFATTPVAPILQRDVDVVELGIADILVNNGVISISQSNITDTRLNTSLCGIVTQTVNTIDTTTLYNQIQTMNEENKQYFLNDFMTWFNTIKDILDENVAAELTNRIIALENKVNTMKLESGSVMRPNGKNVEQSITANETSILALQGKDGDLTQLQTTNKANLVGAINELFQSANNGKNIIATAVGAPLTSNDTFPQMGAKIDTLEGKLRTNLNGKGVTTLPSDEMSILIDKVRIIDQIPDIQFLKDWITIDNNSTKTLDCDSTNAIFDGEKMHIMLATSYSSGTSYSNGKHVTYEPKTDLYVEEKKPPINYAGTCTALLNTEQKKSIFVFGGQVWNSSGWTYYRENREYDIFTKTWTIRNPHKNNISYKSATIDNDNRILYGYDFEYDIDLSTYTDIELFKNYLSSQLVHIGSNTIYGLEFANDSTSKNIYIVCYDTLLKTRTIECTIDIGINYRINVLGRACFYYEDGFLYICVNKQVIKYSIETKIYSIIKEYTGIDTFQGVFFNYKKSMFAKFKELKCLIKY